MGPSRRVWWAALSVGIVTRRGGDRRLRRRRRRAHRPAQRRAAHRLRRGSGRASPAAVSVYAVAVGILARRPAGRRSGSRGPRDPRRGAGGDLRRGRVGGRARRAPAALARPASGDPRERGRRRHRAGSERTARVRQPRGGRGRRAELGRGDDRGAARTSSGASRCSTRTGKPLAPGPAARPAGHARREPEPTVIRYRDRETARSAGRA